MPATAAVHPAACKPRWLLLLETSLRARYCYCCKPHWVSTTAATAAVRTAVAIGNHDEESSQDDGALDQADVAYSANSFMAVVKPVTLCMTLSAFITVSLYSDAEGATNRCLCLSSLLTLTTHSG